MSPSYCNNFAVRSADTAISQRSGNVQGTLSCSMCVCAHEIVSHWYVLARLHEGIRKNVA